jgi:hypothetical protein
MCEQIDKNKVKSDSLVDVIKASQEGKGIDIYNPRIQKWVRATGKFFDIRRQYRVRPETQEPVTGFIVLGSAGQFIGGARDWDTLARNDNFTRWVARGYRFINVREIE